VDRPLGEISARETVNELLSLLRRHHIRMPGPLALLLKALVMMEGVGLQLDPNLDVFGIARPYVQQAIIEGLSPVALSDQALRGARDLGEVAIELPYQAAELIQRLNAGDLRIQTEEHALRRVSGAMIESANRIAIALVLAAMIFSVGMIAIAVGVAGWTGFLPTMLLTIGILTVAILTLALGIALLRPHE
jgi:ubiquinone biosynthesis protein